MTPRSNIAQKKAFYCIVRFEKNNVLVQNIRQMVQNYIDRGKYAQYKPPLVEIKGEDYRYVYLCLDKGNFRITSSRKIT
jgi:hypothetical protein